MGLLGKVLHFFGIGTPQVQILLDKPAYDKNGNIEGIIEIRGGANDIDLKGIDISLVENEELHSNKIDKVNSILETVHLNYVQFTILSASRYEIAFSLTIPPHTSVSSPGIEHQIHVNLSVPGWDSSIIQPIIINEPIVVCQPNNNYHNLCCAKTEEIIAQKTGYRVFCWSNGFGATCRDHLSLFHWNGRLIAHVPCCGLGVSVHASGEMIVSWNKQNEVFIIEPFSGKIIHQWVSELPIHQIHWFDDELILLSEEQFHRFTCQGEKLKHNQEIAGFHGIGGITRTTDGRMFFSETKSGYIQEFFPSTGPIGNRLITSAPEGLSSGPQNTLLAVSGDSVMWLDSKMMVVKQIFKIPGKQGIYANPNQASQRHWNVYPRLSKDTRMIALNDRSGQIQIIDTSSGKVLHTISRDIANLVEHVSWLNNDTLLAVEACKTLKMIDLKENKITWKYSFN